MQLIRSTSICNILRMGKYWYFRFSPTFNPVTGETKYHSYQLLTTKSDLWFELPEDLRRDIINDSVDFTNLKDYGDGQGKGGGYLSVLEQKQQYGIKLTSITKGELTPLTSKVSINSFAVISFTWYHKDQDLDDISRIQSITIVWKKASKYNPFKPLNTLILQCTPNSNPNGTELHPQLDINLPKGKGTNVTYYKSSDELWKAFFNFLENTTLAQQRGRRFSFFIPGMSDPVTIEKGNQGTNSKSSQPSLVSLIIKAALKQDKYYQRPFINQKGNIIELIGSLSLEKGNFNTSKWVSLLKAMGSDNKSEASYSTPRGNNITKSGAATQTSQFSQSDPSVYNIPITEDNIPSNPDHLNTLQEKPITHYKAINDFISFFIRHFNINPINFNSLATLSMAIFRKNFYDPSNTQAKGTIKIGVDKIRDDHIRKAYYGGRIEAYMYKADKGYMYDTNSQYAKAMLNRQPIGQPVEVLSETPDFFGFGFYSITSPATENTPFLPYRHKGDASFEFITGEGIHTEDSLEKLLKTLNIDHITTPSTLLFPLGKWSGWYFSEEIKYARTLGYTCTFIQGYTYKEYGTPLAQYANFIYNQRESVSGPYKGITKLQLNQLYGKFGSQVISTQGLITNNSSLVSKIKDTLIIQNIEPMLVDTKALPPKSKDVYQYLNFFFLPNNEYITKDPFSAKKLINDFFINNNNRISNLAIAAAISAYARIDIDKIIRETTRSDSNNVLQYCDTDCVIFSKPLPSNLIGTHLGQMSNVIIRDDQTNSKFEPYIKDLVCFGPKALSYEVVNSEAQNQPQPQRVVKIQGITSDGSSQTKGEYQISSEQLRTLEPNSMTPSGWINETLDLNLRYSLDVVNSLLQKQYTTNPEVGEQEDDFLDWHWDYLVNEWFTYNPTINFYSLDLRSLPKGQDNLDTEDVTRQFEVGPKEELNRLLSLKKRPNISLLNQLEVINTKTEVFKREPIWEKGILIGSKPLIIKPKTQSLTQQAKSLIQPITKINLDDDQVNHGMGRDDNDMPNSNQTNKFINNQNVKTIRTSQKFNRNIRVYFDFYDPSLNIYTDHNYHTHLLLKDFTPITFKDYIYENEGLTIQWRKLEEDGSIYSLSHHITVKDNQELIRTFEDSLISPATESGETELKYCKMILKVLKPVSWEDTVPH